MDINLKKQLRKDKLLLRKQIDHSTYINCSKEITEKVISSELYKDASIILLYYSYNNEVSTEYLYKQIIADGKRAAFPKCTSYEGEPSMDFYYIDVLEDLCEGYKGILEPNLNKNLELVSQKADLCIVPMSVFDEECNRIGYGGGYYDRFLSKGTVSNAIGVAFEFQKCAKVPIESTDYKLDMIITETNIYTK